MGVFVRRASTGARDSSSAQDAALAEEQSCKRFKMEFQNRSTEIVNRALVPLCTSLSRTATWSATMEL